MGSLRSRVRHVPQWMSTLDQMKRWGTHVRCLCSACGFWSEINIDPLILILGWDGSLWDRRPPCPFVDCSAPMTFHASPGDSSPMRLLCSGVDVEALPPQAWMGGWVGTELR